jgi:hypothetical protein
MREYADLRQLGIAGQRCAFTSNKFYQRRIWDLYELSFALIKENKIFLIHEEIQNGAVAKSYMTNGLLILWLNICAFPHILGSHSSAMTLQLHHSELTYI